MKILIVSDNEEPYIWDHFDKERFADVEMIISCGDLKAEYLSFLVTLINAPLFYVPGNHNESYSTTPPEGCISIDGRMEVYKGIRLIGFGGSNLYSMGAYQYTDKQMARRIKRSSPSIRRHHGFDILVSHAPAFCLGDGSDVCHIGFKSFVNLIEKYSPKYFFHGHQHLSYINRNASRIIQYKNTTIINSYGYFILDYETGKKV